ncbi:hypothetical protein PCANC_28425 [Puccinia coronata f. sp. avenae]|uniref:Uncharacterized protein n=1 Tax=Puccinia coronata f. sp. avenae TaxID=200324 RepID=A0A2N5THN2_9BASI|nr:hypothetical protein PCANC_28425 [Puccinia coronata f. sp. avenae]
MPSTRNSKKTCGSLISSSQPPPQSDKADDTSQDPSREEEDPASEGAQPLTNAKELKQAIKVNANTVSVSYRSYGKPKLSNQKDKLGRHMIAYPFQNVQHQDQPPNVRLLM